jgi:hypothetical protein
MGYEINLHCGSQHDVHYTFYIQTLRINIHNEELYCGSLTLSMLSSTQNNITVTIRNVRPGPLKEQRK